MHKTRALPVAVHHYDATMATTVRRVVGYRAACDCGWASAVRTTMALARADARSHREAGDAAGHDAAAL